MRSGSRPLPGPMSTSPPTVALLPGSIRASSLHRRLADVVGRGLAERGVEVGLVDLVDFPMPIYHGDEEAGAGAPRAAQALHDHLAGFDGIVILSPEYNGGPSPLLKNAIDWVTRVDRSTLRRPLVGLAATSPGSRGGVQGLALLRSIGEHMRLRLAATDFSLPDGANAMESTVDGWRLVSDDDARRLDDWLDEYVSFLHRHRAELTVSGEGGMER